MKVPMQNGVLRLLKGMSASIEILQEATRLSDCHNKTTLSGVSNDRVTTVGLEYWIAEAQLESNHSSSSDKYRLLRMTSCQHHKKQIAEPENLV